MTRSQPATERGSRRSVPAVELPVERVQPSYVQVASQLRALILGGTLSPGERLPAEGDLASQFGVSRSTAREALRLLAAEGLIETRRGVTGGAFIVHPDPADLERALSVAVNLAAGTDRLSMAELFETWEITQVPAAALAARRRTDDEAARLVELAQPWRGSRARAPELILQSIEFHNLVIDAARNRLLKVYARPLNSIAAESLEDDAASYEFVVEANERHLTIAHAIGDRDEAAARQAMAHDMAQPALHHDIATDANLTG